MQQQSEKSLDDQPSTALLYQRYAPAMFAYLRQHTPTREDAEDVLVDVFLAALEYSKFPVFSEKEQLAWLWRVTHNKAVDHYRRSKHRQSVDLEQVAETLYDDDNLAPEQAALRQEEYTHLQSYLQNLSPLQQEVLRLRFTNDLRCAEIAAKLGKREGTIRVMLSRAMNVLRSIYEHQ
jgi:RNA polymerase sigma factor (sigma-70 family)